MKKPRWTKEQVEYLINNYSKLNKEELILNLNKTWKQITIKAFYLKIQRKELKYKAISKSHIKHKFNNDFFKIWDKDMSYILGLWFADGCIQNRKDKYNNDKYSWRLTLHKDDSYLLKDISGIIGETRNLYSNKYHNCLELQYSSKEFYNDIILLGGCKRKSFINLKFPNIPEQYLNHFIRGFFDGDGYISLDKNNGFCSGFCGKYNFLNKLKEILNNKNINGTITKSSSRKYPLQENYKLVITGIKNIHNLYNYIYNDFDLKLLRKYNKFKEIFNLKGVVYCLPSMKL